MQTRQKGLAAEQEVKAWLEGQGYQVVDHNVRTLGGELDLVAYDGATLCFIEVRSRADEQMGGPLETVGPAKQRRLIRAARGFLLERFNSETETPVCRFDVVGVTRQPAKIELVKGAFTA